MDASDKKQFSLPYLLTAVGSTAVAVAGATWGLAVYTQSNELEGYRKAKEWNVGESISELHKLSSALNITVAEKKELLALRTTARKLESLEESFAAMTKERDQLAVALKSVTEGNEKHVVANGSSSYLLPNLLIVAVVRASPILNQCEVRIGNRRLSMEVGETIGGTASGIDYQLSLTRVATEACEFNFSRTNG